MNKLLLSAAIITAALYAVPAAYAADTDTVTGIEIGASREEVHLRIGAPQSVSPDGSKETYTLESGETAVLRYRGEELQFGYIII